MWRALFIGWLALALAEETAKKDDTPAASLTKRQHPRGSTVVYGASPGQYSLQSGGSAHAQPQAQIPSDYQQQSELYVISPNRKPAASALTYSSESPRRPQYIQLSALQLQAAQQATPQHHIVQQHQVQQPQQQLQQHQQQQQQQQQQIAYESLIGQTEAGHGSFYRPAVRYQSQPQPQPQPEARAQPEHQAVQYAASAIVDSHAGSFERELAQLVAANRAQEQKYNAGQVSKKLAAPQQYLKEVTRPAPRPISAARVAPSPVQYQPIPVNQQSAPLYRLIYQADQLQQLPQVNAQPQYKQQASHEPAQYTRPQLQQYIHAQPHAQPQLQLQQVRLRPEDDGAQLLRAHQAQAQAQTHAPTASPIPQSQHRPSSNDASTSSRSTIYVSQSTPLKKPAYSALAALAATQEEEPKQQVRLPQRNRPLTQDEFQQLIQSGAYTATLVPSDNPNSPHHEYLLHPTAGQQHAGQVQAQAQARPVYTSEKQEPQAVTYLLPQSQHQRQVKRRPVYNIQQA